MTKKPEKRVCAECGENKKLSEFAINLTASSGRGIYCKECENEEGRRESKKKDFKDFMKDLRVKYGKEPVKSGNPKKKWPKNPTREDRKKFD